MRRIDHVRRGADGCASQLLRVLQEREFERIGSSHPIKTDVRVLAPTNCDLQKSIHEHIVRICTTGSRLSARIALAAGAHRRYRAVDAFAFEITPHA